MGLDDFEKRFVWYAKKGSKAALQYVLKDEYLKNGFLNAETVFGSCQNIFGCDENVACKVRVGNLKPSSEYFYRVGDGNEFGEVFAFKTQDTSNKRSFAVISDLHMVYKPHDDNFWQWRCSQWENTINQINKFDGNLAFLLSAGDNISSYNMGLENDAEQLKKICEMEHQFLFEPKLMKTIPFASVMGNHEAQYYPQDNPNSSVMGYHFDMPNDDGVSGHIFNTTAGNFCFLSCDVLIIGLNFMVDNRGNFKNTDYEINEKYIKFATEKYPNASWRVVITHIQGFTFIGDGTGEETEYMIKKQDELCSKYKVDLMLTGHAHGFARSYPINNQVPLPDIIENINDVDTILNPNATVHYNIPSALGHSFTSVWPQYNNYIKKYGVSQMRAKNVDLPNDIIEYSSPMFLHINVDETKDDKQMYIRVMESKNLVSIDDFCIVKSKNKK